MSSYPIYIFSEGQVATLHSDGEIWAYGKRVARLYGDGEVYSYGEKVGSFSDDGSFWGLNGPSGWKVYGDGDIYNYGNHVGKIYGYEEFRSQGVSSTGGSVSYVDPGSSGGYGGSGYGYGSSGDVSPADSSSSGGLGCGTIGVIVLAMLVIGSYGMGFEAIAEGRFDDAIPAAILTVIFARMIWKKFGKKSGAKAKPPVTASIKEKMKSKMDSRKPAGPAAVKPVKPKPVKSKPAKPANYSGSGSKPATSGSRDSYAGMRGSSASRTGGSSISWEDDGDRVFVYCPTCGGRSAVSRTSGTLQVKCSLCGKKFEKRICLSEGRTNYAPDQKEGKAVAICPACGEESYLPRVSGTIRVTCLSCGERFDHRS